MSHLDIFLHLGESAPQFKQHLEDIKAHWKVDIQHVLQLSNGWCEVLESRHLQVMDLLYLNLRGAATVDLNALEYDTDAWANLEELMRYFRLSPMPLLHALCRLGDRMSEAMCEAETCVRLYHEGRLKLPQALDNRSDAVSEAAVQVCAPPGITQVSSFMSSMQTSMVAKAALADRFGSRRHLVVVNGVVRDLMIRLHCDPLVLVPSLLPKLDLNASSPASAVVQATYQRAVQSQFVQQCSPVEASCILDKVHFMRSLEYCNHVDLRNHCTEWGASMLHLLYSSHVQLCCANYSPATTVDLKEARRKAKERSASTESFASFEEICQKQECRAQMKGEMWAREWLPRRQGVWSELHGRCRFTLQQQAQSGGAFGSLDLDDLCRIGMQDTRRARELQILKAGRSARRARGGAGVEVLKAAARRQRQIALEKTGWTWPLLTLPNRRSPPEAEADSEIAESAAAAAANVTPSADSEAYVDLEPEDERPRKRPKLLHRGRA